MVHRIMRHHTVRLVVILPARIQIPIESREVTARYLNPDPMPRPEPVTRIQRLQRDPVHLPQLHAHDRLIMPIAITQTLARLV
jgi:hypothetical protein